MNALVYVDIDQGIHKGKMKIALNEKRKKLRGFSFSINIANFEAFLLVFKLTEPFISEECVIKGPTRAIVTMKENFGI